MGQVAGEVDKRWIKVGGEVKVRCRRGGRKCEGEVGEELDKRWEEKWKISGRRSG